MRTIKVTREFCQKAEELAQLAKVPEIKFRLVRLVDDYRRKLEELELIKSNSRDRK